MDLLASSKLVALERVNNLLEKKNQNILGTLTLFIGILNSNLDANDSIGGNNTVDNNIYFNSNEMIL